MKIKITSVFSRKIYLMVRFGIKNLHHPIELVKGDTLPVLEFTLVDNAGTPIDLTGKSVLFSFKQSGESLTNSSKNCVITNAILGIVEYTFSSSDLVEIGTYFGDVYIQSGSTVETSPDAVRFVVRDNNK